MPPKTKQKAAAPTTRFSELPSAEWHEIDKTVAGEMLALNTLNRPLKPYRVAMYADAMTKGLWKVTGSPIQFGKSGRLVDGQNRLHAMVASDASIWMLVVRGVDDSVFDVIDTGAARDGRDVLTIEGYERVAAATGSAAAKMAHAVMTGRAPYGSDLRPQGIASFVASYPEIMDSVGFIATLKSGAAPLVQSCSAMLHFFMTKKDAALARDFFTSLYMGTDLVANSIELRLRNRLLNNRKDGSKAITQRTRAEAMAAVINAWNALRRNHPKATLSFALLDDGTLPEIM